MAGYAASLSQSVTLGECFDLLANVPADGSAPVPIAFAHTFSGAPVRVNVTPVEPGSSWSGRVLAAVAFNVTPGGMSVVVAGGEPGATCSLSYSVLGPQ